MYVSIACYILSVLEKLYTYNKKMAAAITTFVIDLSGQISGKSNDKSHCDRDKIYPFVSYANSYKKRGHVNVHR